MFLLPRIDPFLRLTSSKGGPGTKFWPMEIQNIVLFLEIGLQGVLLPFLLAGGWNEAGAPAASLC